MALKVLLVHNNYGSSAPSGENAVFIAEKRLLQEHGHEVREYTRHSDEIRCQGILGNVKGALATPWNPFSARTLRQKVDDFRPDVVHVHNTFPLLSPAIFHAIGHRAARVLTLHNYRLFCPAAIPLRDGKTCTDCLERHSVLPALKHGCYRKSRVATLPLAMNVALHRMVKTWQRQVEGFIALTVFQKELMVKAGLPHSRVHVKPNFYPGNPKPVPWNKRRPAVVFAGRLTQEKGVEILVRAWLQWGASAPELRILGDGPLRGSLEELAQRAVSPIHFLGQQPGNLAQAEIAQAQLLVLPSECFEGFPMVIREAFAFGTPVAASKIGPLPSIVQAEFNGMVFSPGDPRSLLETVKALWETPDRLELMAGAARATFERLYTEDVNYRQLMSIYDQALEVSRKRKG